MIVAIATLLLGPAQATADYSSLPYQKRVTGMAEGWRAKYHVPGVWCAFIKDGKVIACVAAGIRNSDARTPASVNDLLNIGSVSKVLTGMLIAEFIAKGVIAFDTTVGQMFPELVQRYPRCPLSKATLRQVLSHAAGLPRNISDVVPESYRSAIEWRYALVERAFTSTELKEPGINGPYSNFGATLATAMLERALKGVGSFEQWINGPEGLAIGLSNSKSLDWRRAPAKGDVFGHFIATDGTVSVNGKPVPGKRLSSEEFFNPGGSVRTSLVTLASFVQSVCINRANLPSAVERECLLVPTMVGGHTSVGFSMGGNSGFVDKDGDTGLGEFCYIRLHPKKRLGFALYVNASPQDAEPRKIFRNGLAGEALMFLNEFR